MGEHKGWRVRFDKRRGTCRGEVLIPGTGRYRTQTFKGQRMEAEARAWAKREAGGVAMGQPSPEFLTPANVSTADLLLDYMVRMADLRRAPSYVMDAQLMLNSFAGAVPVLTSPAAPRQIETWLRGLVSSGKGRGGRRAQVSPARRNKYLMCARAMCNWAVRKKRIPSDPTASEDFVQVGRFLKPQFGLHELRKLVRQPVTMTHRWAMLMLYAGLRRDEARCIRWQDIDWEGGCIQIVMESGAIIKREKERIVPLQPELRAYLKAIEGGKWGPIVKLGRGNLSRAFEAMMRAAELPIDGRSPHSFRHTYAGVMAATGTSIAPLRAYLGHESEKTTQGYTQLAARYVDGVKHWKRGEFELIK